MRGCGDEVTRNTNGLGIRKSPEAVSLLIP